MEQSPKLIPVFVRKRNQVLISILPRDLSFVIDEGLGRIFNQIDNHKVKVNLDNITKSELFGSHNHYRPFSSISH